MQNILKKKQNKVFTSNQAVVISYYIPVPSEQPIYISVNRTNPHTQPLLHRLVTPQTQRLYQYCTHWKEKERIDRGSARSINKYSFRTRAGLPLIKDLCHCPHKVKEGGPGKGTILIPRGRWADWRRWIRWTRWGWRNTGRQRTSANKWNPNACPVSSGLNAHREPERERKGRLWEMDLKDICLNKCF